jgi:hypothetical protein
MRHCAFAAVVLLVQVGSAQHATAQTAGDNQHLALRIGQFVAITSTDRPRLMGTVTAVSVTEIGVKDGSMVRTLPWDAVTRVETKDSTTDGIVKGAVIGALAGLAPTITVAVICGSTCETLNAAPYIALGAGVGAALGFAVDQSRSNWRTIYSGSHSVSVAPMVGPKAIGVSGALRW